MVAVVQQTWGWANGSSDQRRRPSFKILERRCAYFRGRYLLSIRWTSVNIRDVCHRSRNVIRASLPDRQGGPKRQSGAASTDQHLPLSLVTAIDWQSGQIHVRRHTSCTTRTCLFPIAAWRAGHLLSAHAETSLQCAPIFDITSIAHACTSVHRTAEWKREATRRRKSRRV